MNETNLAQFVHDFMLACDNSTKGFNGEQASLYTGLQLEEMAEKLEAISSGCTVTKDSFDLLSAISTIRHMSHAFKRGTYLEAVRRADRSAMLDADIDLAFVALGGAYSTAEDASGAMRAVGVANLAKAPGGKVQKDANGKVVKPEGWCSPDLSPFVSQPLF